MSHATNESGIMKPILLLLAAMTAVIIGLPYVFSLFTMPETFVNVIAIAIKLGNWSLAGILAVLAGSSLVAIAVIYSRFRDEELKVTAARLSELPDTLGSAGYLFLGFIFSLASILALGALALYEALTIFEPFVLFGWRFYVSEFFTPLVYLAGLVSSGLTFLALAFMYIGGVHLFRIPMGRGGKMVQSFFLPARWIGGLLVWLGDTLTEPFFS